MLSHVKLIYNDENIVIYISFWITTFIIENESQPSLSLFAINVIAYEL